MQMQEHVGERWTKPNGSKMVRCKHCQEKMLETAIRRHLKRSHRALLMLTIPPSNPDTQPRRKRRSADRLSYGYGRC